MPLLTLLLDAPLLFIFFIILYFNSIPSLYFFPPFLLSAFRPSVFPPFFHHPSFSLLLPSFILVLSSHSHGILHSSFLLISPLSPALVIHSLSLSILLFALWLGILTTIGHVYLPSTIKPAVRRFTESTPVYSAPSKCVHQPPAIAVFIPHRMLSLQCSFRLQRVKSWR